MRVASESSPLTAAQDKNCAEINLVGQSIVHFAFIVTDGCFVPGMQSTMSR